MKTYGQYCPIAMATEILGDRWTLLIVRDLLTGVSHFNELERGLPGISRSLLASRLKQLVEAGILKKNPSGKGRKTEYQLTEAGYELQDVIQSLLMWGAKWAFDDPTDEQLDPVLLLWWMKDRVNKDKLPKDRMVIQFDFSYKKMERLWLLMTMEDVSICMTHPGFDTDVIVTADLRTYFKLWMGRISYQQAIADHGIQIDSTPAYIKAFPSWFAWSLAAPAVQAFSTA